MELLELKSLWDAVVDDTLTKDRVEGFDLERSIKKDSRSVLAKIKRVMYFKFSLGGLSVALCTLMLVGSFLNPAGFVFFEPLFDITGNRIFLTTILLFMSAMLSWNFKAFLEIREFESSTSSVRKSLERFIGIMEQTIRLNVYFGVAFNALAVGWVCYLLNTRTGFAEGTWQITLMVLAAIVVGAVVFFYLSRYEQKIKFGRYLDHLKTNLKELSEK